MRPSELFLELLQYGGVPHGHEGVYAPLLEAYGFRQDTVGNWYKAGTLPILLTAHLDTVNRTTGSIPYEIKNGIVYARGTEPLGADDRAGVALILFLSQHLPQLNYALFIGEESGLVGSSQAAELWKQDRWVFGDLTAVISLDRRGTSDVVYTQMGMETASPEFARYLAGLFTPQRQLAHGSFTDSASFVYLADNCTNLSVGYFRPHTAEEHQDLDFLDRTADQLLALPWAEVAEMSLQHPASYTSLTYPTKAQPHKSSYPWYGSWYEEEPYDPEMVERVKVLLYTEPALATRFIEWAAREYPDALLQFAEDMGYL